MQSESCELRLAERLLQTLCRIQMFISRISSTVSLAIMILSRHVSTKAKTFFLCREVIRAFLKLGDVLQDDGGALASP